MVPPPKKDVLAALGIPLATGESPGKPDQMVRKADVDVSNHKFYEDDTVVDNRIFYSSLTW